MSVSLELEGVSLRYGANTVLDDFALGVAASEVVALCGPSGCGKTTVLRLLLGLTAPARGSVTLDGAVASREGQVLLPPEERHLGVVFQDLALWPHLTVRGNLAFGLEAQGVPRDEQAARIGRMLQRVGLGGKEQRAPGELSGGERQRVAIARALVLEPRAVLFDEPLANLDVVLKAELLELFRELLRERATTGVYVTHDVEEAAALGTRIAVMEGGRVVQEGALDELRARPATALVRALTAGGSRA
jgi:ABC-type Fe3+/spermidine/putrescine transport system ATPase subunit